MQRFKDLNLVIDFGTKCCRVGVSGESSPRLILVADLTSDTDITELCKSIRKELVISNDFRSIFLCERVDMTRKFKEAILNAVFKEFQV